jgi:hypothetical protein
MTPAPRQPQLATEQAYSSPTITRLGTLAELTQGGSPGPNDGFGGAGDVGSG